MSDFTRHLIFHVYPATNNKVWQRNVEQILKRIHLFNGKKIAAVVCGVGLNLPKRVKDAFGKNLDELLVFPNSKRLREVATFEGLFSRVLVDDPNHCFFYAHAKGVTRPVNPGVTVHRWADIMYETCLDYWPLVEDLFRQGKSLAGSFKKIGHGFGGSRSSWHYSGAFFWAKSQAVLAKDWKVIDKTWWGTEAWPGLHFSPEEAGCLFHEAPLSTMDLYSMGYFENTVQPLYDQWKLLHVDSRRTLSE